jgi:hypothetical protein
MSLDIQLFKKGFDIHKSRAEIDAAYIKLQALKEALEQLEDEYEESMLSSHNISHNLNTMAEAAGLYDVLWNPESIGITTASQMIPLLEKGIKELIANPDKYKAFNPPNKFGSYENLVDFCNTVLQKCRENPDAVIEVGK